MLKSIDSEHFRKIVAMAILVLSLTTIYVASLNIKKTALPPGMYLQRFWKDHFPADSVNPPNIQKGDMNISVADTYFDNAFIKYEKIVTGGANNPTVKYAQYYNMTIEGIPTLILKTEAETIERGVYIIFDFILLQTIEITNNTVMMTIVETAGNADVARIELSGSNLDGEQKVGALIDLPQNKDFFVFNVQLNQREELEDFATIKKISIVYYCQPNSQMNVTTQIRVLNIFDGTPTLNDEPLEWGRNYLYQTDIAFPHKVGWDYLKPSQIFLVSTLHELIATWHPLLYSMNYTWLIQNHGIARMNEANAVIWIDRFNDAQIISAKITAQENELDFLVDIQQNLLSSSRYVRNVQPIPTEYEEAKITLVFDYWPTPWREIALVSGIIIVINFLVFRYKRIVRDLSIYFAKMKSSISS